MCGVIFVVYMQISCTLNNLDAELFGSTLTTFSSVVSLSAIMRSMSLLHCDFIVSNSSISLYVSFATSWAVRSMKNFHLLINLLINQIF